MKIESWTALSIVALATAALPGCTKTLDEAKIEAAITEGIKADDVTLKSVKCPNDRQLKAGDKFECSGELPEGGKVVFHVEQKDDQGNLSWKTDGALINQLKFGHKLEATLKGSKVNCPPKVVILKKGDKFMCDFTHENEHGKVAVTAKDDDGNVETTTL